MKDEVKTKCTLCQKEYAHCYITNKNSVLGLVYLCEKCREQYPAYNENGIIHEIKINFSFEKDE
jgi:hypothetical protein